MAFIRTMIFFGGIRPSGRTVLIQTLLGDVASQVPQATTETFAPADAARQITSGSFGGQEAWPLTDEYLSPFQYAEGWVPADAAGQVAVEAEAWPLTDEYLTSLSDTDAIDWLMQPQGLFTATESPPITDTAGHAWTAADSLQGVTDNAAIAAVATEGWAITDTASSP